MSEPNSQEKASLETPQNQPADQIKSQSTNGPQAYAQPKSSGQKYIGLPNQGATCYMNSLLQTLFMTPEFRSALYNWKYDEKKDARPEDCIPLQLQKLFASLQLKHSACVTTKPLTKSFQWEESTSFEQHDIQEFSSVLFDAIDQSMRDAKSDVFLNDLYEGTSVSYVKCLECGHESSRPENFLNIGLTVKNEFDQIYNDNLLKALQIYLRPEKLEGSNQYFCDSCNKKVDATKGTKFVKFPKLLNMIINRFSFDFIYLRRVKLDDFFGFPFILNMNDYINGYEGIKNKVNESSTPEFFNEYKKKRDAKREAEKAATNAAKQSAGDTASGDGKSTRPPVKSFIADLKKRGEQNKQNKIDVVIYTKDVDGTGHPSVYEDDSENLQENNDANKAPESNNIATNPSEGKDKEQARKDEANSENKKQEEVKVNVEAQKEKEERERQRKEERENLINQYLKDGPLVYELFSILIHSGGAYGGHYYAYIKSLDDSKWYNFNDTVVSEIDPEEIPEKAFGGGKSANAYMLIYRQVESSEEERIVISQDAIPEYLKKFIEEEAKKQLELENQRIEKAKNMNLRVYYKNEMKFIPGHFEEKFKDFQAKVFDLFGVQEKPGNARLRLYHHLTSNMQETFTGREDKTLGELKITTAKSLCIEVKTDDQEFEDYDGDNIYFKVTLWREGLPDVTEASLRPVKVGVRRDGVLRDLLEAISMKFDIPVEHVRLIKKVQKAGFPTAVVISAPENMDIKYYDLKIFEGLILFVERAEIPEAPVLWREEFEKDAYNYKILFNSPYLENTEFAEETASFVVIDARKSLGELKTEICKKIELNEGDVIIKRGSRSGIEFKNMRQTIISANLVNNSSIFVEFGRPATMGEMRIFVTLALKVEDEDDILSYEFEDLGEISVINESTAQELKEKIAEEMAKKKIYEWDPKKLRLRERINNTLVRVYRNLSLQNQGVCDKKQIAVEILDEPESLAPKENLVICRVWDQETLELGPRFEVIVDRSKTLRNLAEKIYEKDQTVKPENMMGMKVMEAWGFSKYDLLYHEWAELDDEDKIVYNEPLNLNIDGAYIFIKDKTKKDKELSEEEKKIIGIARAQNKSGRPSDGYSAYSTEKSLKIHVKKKENNEETSDQTSEQKNEKDIEAGPKKEE